MGRLNNNRIDRMLEEYQLSVLFYNLGKQAGIIGFACLSFLIISGDTARLFDRYFGLDKIIKFQRKFSLITAFFIVFHPLFFILTTFLLLITLVIGALNLALLLIPIKKISFAKVFYYNTLSWSLGLFVPGKIGELSLIPFLKQEGVPTGHGTVISVLDKLISLVVLSLSSIIGFFIFFDIGATLKLIAILFLLIAVILFFIVSNAGRSFIKKYILRKFSMKFQGFSKLLFYYFKKQKLIIFLNIIITFIKWIVNAVILYTLFLAYNQNVPFVYIFLINSMLTIISLIPISISGLGVRESIAVFIYGALSINPLITISTHLIPLIISYFIAILTILFSFKKLSFRI